MCLKNMKGPLVLMVCVLCVVLAKAQTEELFVPVQEIDLRAPSVPIIVSDPYLSIWSPYDRLNEGSTEHWSGAKKPILGVLKVDGNIYRFLGKDEPRLLPVLPMSETEIWSAAYTREHPLDDWYNINFDDSGWLHGQAPFGSAERHTRTHWGGDDTDIYIRRTFELSDVEGLGDIYLVFSHDDVFELYLNGLQVVDTGLTWNDNVVLKLSDEVRKNLRTGTNVLAAHGHNTTGGAYVDFGLFRERENAVQFTLDAVQESVDVLPTSSYYTFACGPVELCVVFTAPQIIDDLDLLSTPINYISYRVKSLDNKKHEVQLYIETTPRLAVNEPNQPTISTAFNKNGISYIKAGTIGQPYCERKGDQICQDWGYVYLACVEGNGKALSLGDYYEMKRSFVNQGSLIPSELNRVTRKASDVPAMAYTHDLGMVDKDGITGFVMIGYDDIYCVEYMYEKRMAYWKHDGQVTIHDAFEYFGNNYQTIMERCKLLDARIYNDALQAGGKKYAEICALAYRHVISAHKLFIDNKGNLLWFSKENNSNGCINTVDLTYPSAPLFLVYNPELVKGMMTSILEYSASGRWNHPFAAHDLGTYPVANGQVYGGHMPIEESGNMVILAAALSRVEGNADYAKKYWDVLTTWVNYLVANGQDPENQLCTDDFAGHWAHNANLAVKAIMGIAGYGEMAKMLGLDDVATQYSQIAKNMALKWERMANDGDHYRLAFDRPDTWSQKYNMVWDKVWQSGLFPSYVFEKEIRYYLTQQNTYGLPLDCRREYTKSDWISWIAAMAPDQATFEKFIDPLYKYINETVSRVPNSDWYHTDSGEWVSFRARSVIGAYWMKVLMNK